MTVSRKSRRKQVPGPIPLLERTLPDNDPGPARCPTCGHPFDVRTSGLLDMLHLAKDVLCDLQAALEEERLP
jgi:hypothetical protein